MNLKAFTHFVLNTKQPLRCLNEKNIAKNDDASFSFRLYFAIINIKNTQKTNYKS